MSTLHTVNKTAHSSDVLHSCLRLLAADDALLLIEDAVYQAADSSANRELLQACSETRCYALQEDLSARGISTTLPFIQAIDYAGFVALVCEYDKTVNWF